MRQIGTLGDEDQARRFEDYALTRGIRTRVEQDDGRWAVWVYEEDHVAQGKEELESFQQNPDDERYVSASRSAESIRRQDEKLPFAERITAAELLQALQVQRAITAGGISIEEAVARAEPENDAQEPNNITAIDLKSRTRDRSHEDR